MVKPKKNKGAHTREQLKKQGKQSELQSLEALKNEIANFDESTIPELERFEQLPISSVTKKGLRESHFVTLTPIQRESIIPALKGNDILGAAKTGSGKTLAFLIPILEKLYLERWSHMDGLGALVITPTRELATQIFEVLRKVGRFHQFSAGVLVGGKDVKAEKDRIGRLNILVCTPGRLLQHMDESFEFSADNLQMLVLDEADRLLDMGFKKTLDAIVASLSPERQTALFSATQTKNVNDLARLSLANPKYISVDAENPSATPQGLEQYYTVCDVDKKLDDLWSFLRSHTKAKVLVFISSSKQVRFIFESFRRMRPGIPLMHLHGRQKQTARMEIVQKFTKSRCSCLFATDVVARGIDFPEVDWVVQLDCPEDASTYIHRVGRSARAGKQGRALLFLTPSEEKPFLERLKVKKVPIQKLTIKESRRKSIQPDLQAQCFQDPELKYLAQKAFISYVRSIYIHPDKDVFDVQSIPLDDFAKSLGLASAPNVKIKGDHVKNENKNKSRALLDSKGQDPEKVRTKYDKMFNRQNQNVLSEHYQKLTRQDDEESEDDFMAVKKQDHDLDEGATPQLMDTPESKRAAKRALSKKQAAIHAGKAPSKIVFDDDGNQHAVYEFQDEEDFHKAGDAESQRQGFLEAETVDMENRDATDKLTAKEKREEKKRRRKELEKGELDIEDDEPVEAQLEGAGEHINPFEDLSDEEEKPSKRHKKQRVMEIEEPETLEDLEALSAKLLHG